MTFFSSIFLIFLCFFCGCQKNLPKRSHLKINTPGEPPTLDARKCSDNVSSTIITMCFDGLTRRDINNHVQLSLAKSLTVSEDKKIYTFELKDACWSNGQKITAFEFEETWKQLLKPEFPSLGSILLYKIKNAKLAKEGLKPIEDVAVRALNEKVLQVELEHPMDSFLELLSSTQFYPYPKWVAENNLSYIENKQKDFICNGPFAVTKWKTQHHMLFEKNQSYWDKDSVKLDQITLSFVLDQSTELSMYEQGDLDWCGQPISVIPTDALSQIKNRDDFHSYKMSGIYFYLFNTSLHPLNNANIRKALTLAINRKNLISHVIQVDHDSATSFIPNTILSLNKNFFVDGDNQKAREFFKQGLNELGITLNEFPKIELSFNTEPSSHFKIAQAVQQQWNSVLGIKTTLKNCEWKVYLDELNHGRFHIARMGSTVPCSDASFFIEQFAYKGLGFNFANWYNEDFKNLYCESQNTLDTKEKLKILNDAESIFMEEMPIAPIYFYTNCYLKKPYVKNVALATNGSIDFKWAYLDFEKDSP